MAVKKSWKPEGKKSQDTQGFLKTSTARSWTVFKDLIINLVTSIYTLVKQTFAFTILVSPLVAIAILAYSFFAMLSQRYYVV